MTEQVVTVTSSSELYNALVSLSNGTGGTIKLVNTGEPYSLKAYQIGSEYSSVSIVAENPLEPPEFTHVILNQCAGITFSGLKFANYGTTGHNEILFIKSSSNISFEGSEFLSSADGKFIGDGLTEKGLNIGSIRNSDGVSFSSNTFSGFNQGLTIIDSNGTIITDNVFTKMVGDGLRMSGVIDTVVSDNSFSEFYGSLQEYNHSDFIQVWSATYNTQNTENLLISGNYFSSSGDQASQTIFIKNETFSSTGVPYLNITIQDNIIYNAHLHGITVYNSEGVTVAHNTLLFDPSASMQATATSPEQSYAPEIRLTQVSGAEVFGNIASGYYASGVDVSGNVIVSGDPESENYVAKHIDMESFLVRADSPWYGLFGYTGVSDTPPETDSPSAVIPDSGETSPVADPISSPEIDPISSPEPSPVRISYEPYTLDGYVASATELHRKKLLDDAHVVETSNGLMIRLDGDGDYVNLGRLRDMEKSDQITFSVSFRQAPDDGGQAPLVWNDMRMGLSVEGDGIAFQIATADEGFKSFRIGNLGLDDNELHTAYVVVDAATDRLQIVVDNQLVLDESETDFAFINASPREWGWTLGKSGSDFFAGDVGTFRVDDVAQFFEIYGATAESDLVF